MTNDRVFAMLVQTRVLMGVTFAPRQYRGRDVPHPTTGVQVVGRAAQVPEHALEGVDLAEAAESFVEAALGWVQFPEWYLAWRESEDGKVHPW
jgi:hypothetical protein